MTTKRKFVSIQAFSDSEGQNFVAIADDGTAWVGGFSVVTGNVVAWKQVLSLPEVTPAPMKISAEALNRAGTALR